MGSESSGYAIAENQGSEMRLLSDEKGRKHRKRERERERKREKEGRKKRPALRRYKGSNLTTN